MTQPKIRFNGFSDEWVEKKFKDIAALSRGLTYKPSSVSMSGVRVLRSSNVFEDRFLLKNDDVFVNSDAVNIPPIKNGDILITSANGSNRLVGKHAIVKGLHEKTVHGGFMLKAESDMPEFVNALMNAEWYSEFISKFVSGGNGAIGNLKKNDLDNQLIRVPSLSEQQKIGALFSKYDAIISLYEQKLAELNALKKGVLQQMFDDGVATSHKPQATSHKPQATSHKPQATSHK